MKHPERQFLRLPEYPGGKEALKKYIRENLVYPEEALKRKIQGMVHLIAEIDDNGDVTRVEVQKGIGAGCDEEAVRLIGNIRFGGVKNRGIRVKSTRKFRVEFKLPPEKGIRYEVVNKLVKEDVPSPVKYSYTVQIRRDN